MPVSSRSSSASSSPKIVAPGAKPAVAPTVSGRHAGAAPGAVGAAQERSASVCPPRRTAALAIPATMTTAIMTARARVRAGCIGAASVRS